MYLFVTWHLGMFALAAQSAGGIQPICSSRNGFLHEAMCTVLMHLVMHLPRLPSDPTVGFPGSGAIYVTSACHTCSLASASSCCLEVSSSSGSEGMRFCLQPGVTTDFIDRKVHEMAVANGAYPSPLGYGKRSILVTVSLVSCCVDERSSIILCHPSLCNMCQSNEDLVSAWGVQSYSVLSLKFASVN